MHRNGLESAPDGARKAPMERNRVWVVAARVEDEQSFFAEDPITSEKLRRMVASYDPEFRLAPVIAPWSPRTGQIVGPSHFAGQWGPPLGFIRSLDFDGLNLWAEIEELEDVDGNGQVAAAVAAGYLGRSIGWWDATPELEGTPPYLRHLALLGGENPGIANMPPLTDYYAATSRSMEMGSIIANAPYCTRSLLDHPVEATEPSRATLEDDTMDEKQIREMVAESVRSAISDSLPAALSPVLQPMQDRMASLEGALGEIRTQMDTTAADSRVRSLTERVDSLVRSGRLTPAQRDLEVETLKALPAEIAERRLQAASAGQPVIGFRATTQDPAPTFNDGEAINMRRFTLPTGGPGSAVDPRSISELKAAREAAGGDPAKFRTAALALYGEQEV